MLYWKMVNFAACVKNKIFYRLLSPALSFMSFLRETLREIKDTQMYAIGVAF
jgi:hypothetical protein